MDDSLFAMAGCGCFMIFFFLVVVPGLLSADETAKKANNEIDRGRKYKRSRRNGEGE